MSYSFSLTANTQEEARGKITEEFDRIELSQPVHKADRNAAQAAAEAFSNILGDAAEGEEIKVNVSGSVSWRGENDFTGVALNISCGRYPAPKS